MTGPIARIADQAKLSARALLEYGQHLLNPTIRLGVTGLSRAGKTVFLTALVHGLLRGGRFPVFEPYSGGRIAGARLAPQPDDGVPRFEYEKHLRALIEDRLWPDSTKAISELRLVIDYQSKSGADRTLTLDLVDYPGEWLLDLPLLSMSYEQWSADSLTRSWEKPRDALAKAWHTHLKTLDPLSAADENDAIEAARLFTDYLRACRDEQFAMSVLPPGRFLMPGDLENSPALTFAPLDLPVAECPKGSLWSMMRRRYEAYKDLVVRPFFVDHFQRLDRQLVLVDALAAFNAGPHAVHDLESALTDILGCFQVGRRTLLSSMFAPRADKVLFAATKADHLHHTSHDRLEAILRRMVTKARRPRAIFRRGDRRCRARGRAGDARSHGVAQGRDAAVDCRRCRCRREDRRQSFRRQDRSGGVSGRPSGRSGGDVRRRQADRRARAICVFFVFARRRLK